MKNRANLDGSDLEHEIRAIVEPEVLIDGAYTMERSIR